MDPARLVGGYARAYDLISTEYGWTDEAIGDLTLLRLRQITASIEMRKWAEFRKVQALTTWQTRTLATFTAAGYMTDGENPAVEAAGRIAYDELEEALLEEAEIRKDEASATDPEWTPDMGSMAKPNGIGSFEKFTRAVK